MRQAYSSFFCKGKVGRAYNHPNVNILTSLHVCSNENLEINDNNQQNRFPLGSQLCESNNVYNVLL